MLRTSKAQWMWEYFSYQRKERDEREWQIKAMKQVLVSVLGLNLAPPMNEKGDYKTPDEMTPEDADHFIPMVLLAGNHHLLAPHLKKLKAQFGNSGEQSKVSDDEYEQQAAAMMNDGDLDPILDPLVGQNPREVLLKQQEERLGIKVLDDRPKNQVIASEEAPKPRVRNTVVIEE